MTTTQTGDSESRTADPRVRLRIEVVDALMAAKGVSSVVDQARAVGVHRSHLFRVRSGEVQPGLGLAMKLARAAGTTVEALFELRGDDHV